MKSTFIKVMAAVVLATSLHADSSKSLKKELKSVHKKLDDITKLELRLNKMAPKPITQKKIDEAGGTLVLNCSGDYCLTENVTGALLVHADSVCIDLCCHTLNADGRANAIVADGYQGLKVFDGRIINSTSSAISVNNYSAVELFKLILTDNTNNGLLLANSTDVSVHDIDCINDGAGERALWFDGCDNILVNHVNASGYLSTIGAVMQLDECSSALIENVNVTDNRKTAAADANEYSAATAFVSCIYCDGIDLVEVKANNNIFDNSVPLADQVNHWRTAEAINFSFCTNCSLYRTESCNNTDLVGSQSTPLTEDSMLSLHNCSGFMIREHQSNNNSCTTAISSLIGLALFETTESVLDGCQANANSADELYVLPGVFAQLHGIWVAEFPDSRNCVVRNCQANNNRVNLGGEGRSPEAFNPGIVAGIRMNGSGHVVDFCQANNNTMGDYPEFTLVVGILKSADTNGVLSNSTANDNTGSETAYGIAIHPLDFGFVFGANQVVRNCQANFNGNYGISTGLFSDPLPEFALNIEISDCVCLNNGIGPVDAAGIIVINPGPDRSIMIKDCFISDTGTSEAFSAVGIYVITATNVVIEDCNVFNTTADEFGDGIVFDTVTDSKILRTQVHGNQNSGIELTGVNTNIMILDSIAIDNDVGFSVASGSTLEGGIIQGNRALGNTTIGFEHAAVLPAPFDTSYQGNYAQDNGTNYSISNVIQIHTYAIPTATYVFSAGGTNFPTLTNIDAS